MKQLTMKIERAVTHLKGSNNSKLHERINEKLAKRLGWNAKQFKVFWILLFKCWYWIFDNDNYYSLVALFKIRFDYTNLKRLYKYIVKF